MDMVHTMTIWVNRNVSFATKRSREGKLVSITRQRMLLQLEEENRVLRNEQETKLNTTVGGTIKRTFRNILKSKPPTEEKKK